MTRFLHRRRGVALVMALALLVTACGEASVEPSGQASGTSDGWTTWPTSPFPQSRVEIGNPSTVWTGTELVVPGLFSTDERLGGSAAFNPETGSWRSIDPPPGSIVSNGVGLVAVWTGAEILLFGESPRGPNAPDGASGPTVGAAYDPAIDGWRSLAPAPDGRRLDAAAWTGSRLLAYSSGYGFSEFDPASDTWRTVTEETGSVISDDQSSASRGELLVESDQAVWDGSRLVLAGSFSGRDVAFDPERGEWAALPDAPFDIDVLAWSGRDLVGFDGESGDLATLSAGGSWRMRAKGPFENHAPGTALWAAGRFVVLGGLDFDYSPASTPPRPRSGGAAWDPSTDEWSTVPPPPGTSTVVLGGVEAGDRLLTWGLTESPDGGLGLAAAAWAPPG